MLKKAIGLAMACVIASSLGQTVQAGGYVVRSYYAPVAVQPVYPVGVVPVVPHAVVQTTYYQPAPVVVAPAPVVVQPAPVVVAPVRGRVQETVRGNANRTAVRTRYYRPLGILPSAKNVTIERDTPRGVVIRQRGR